MGEKQLNERALELRREYQREWRRKNKEKVRANNLRYWERKATPGTEESKLEPLAVSAPEAARLLGVSKPTIYQYIHRGDFPSFKLGNRTLVSVAGLQEWIRKQVNEQ